MGRRREHGPPPFAVEIRESAPEREVEGDLSFEGDHIHPQEAGRIVVPELGRNGGAVRGDSAVSVEHPLLGREGVGHGGRGHSPSYHEIGGISIGSADCHSPWGESASGRTQVAPGGGSTFPWRRGSSVRSIHSLSRPRISFRTGAYAGSAARLQVLLVQLSYVMLPLLNI